MLSGVTRVLALAAMAPWIDRLPLRAARAVRFAIVLLVEDVDDPRSRGRRLDRNWGPKPFRL